MHRDNSFYQLELTTINVIQNLVPFLLMKTYLLTKLKTISSFVFPIILFQLPELPIFLYMLLEP